MYNITYMYIFITYIYIYNHENNAQCVLSVITTVGL